jgi:predicted ATPase/class 3 adenylate cyclase
MALNRPSGTVTFLFTDIEGSTRLWEADADGMRAALADHDIVLRDAVEARGGWLFKHTGDGVCAVFVSARAAVEAAVDAQRRLGLPVRMGIGTGEAELRGDDYFGPALNRAARVMAAGHGGQILVAASTASVLDGIQLMDLGEHHLRDLSGVHRLFQVLVEGLRHDFPPLRTLDVMPGNLPVQNSSFVGRMAEVEELVGAVRAHRLVTLTGVGGVGKTRLAVQVAGELVPEFSDGVWLVELASVGDPGAVPDAVATALGVVPQPGLTVTESLAAAMAGRRVLIVLDNCEHLLDAVAAVADAVLARSTTAKLLATSREGLRIGGEHLWPVPSLASRDGDGEAVALFVERARAGVPSFTLDDLQTAEAVIEICQRLDGIALAIELAAARTVSMSTADVRDRLGDRFRLLAGARRGLERHQTLRQAVQWSFDLLDNAERTLLCRCSVFAGGFDVAAAVGVCGSGLDEYEVLDLLDSLVRKSLITVDGRAGPARYGLLETIRQFAAEELAGMGGESVDDLRDRHAAHFARQVVDHLAASYGVGYRVALDWVDAELANLRSAFRWTVDRGDLVTAVAIAAHTTMVGLSHQRFEPVGWAEEILEAATEADVPQLPCLYTAAANCAYLGRPEVALRYAQTAITLEASGRYEYFTGIHGSRFRAGEAHRFAGRNDHRLEIYRAMAAEPGPDQAVGLGLMLYVLPEVGGGAEARSIADEAVAAARASGHPALIATALHASGRAFVETEPDRGLSVMRQALSYAREQGLEFSEALFTRDLASVEAVHGDRVQGLRLFDTAIEAFHRAGNGGSLALTLGYLTMFLDSIGETSIAATVHGASTRYSAINTVPNLPATVEHLRLELGEPAFSQLVAAGAEMEPAEAVRYARQQIDALCHQPSEPLGGAVSR